MHTLFLTVSIPGGLGKIVIDSGTYVFIIALDIRTGAIMFCYRPRVV